MVRLGPIELTRAKSLPLDLVGAEAGLTGAFLFGGDGLLPAGGNVLSAYRESPWLRAVANKIASAVAMTTWQLFVQQGVGGKAIRAKRLQRAGYRDRTTLLRLRAQAGELAEIESHPLLDLLDDPNSELTGLAARKLTQLHLDLAGEAFWLLERNRLGMPLAFWPLAPSWVRRRPSGPQGSYEITFGAWRGEVPASEIVAMIEPDPARPYGRGTGMAEALGDEIDTDEYAAKHVRQWFQNRARPDLIVSADGLQKAETTRLEQEWANRHQGFWRAFKPFFVNRKLEVKELNQSFQSMQLVELRKHERDMIVEVFGLPPELLGILQNSNRATIEAADHLFSQWVVLPRLESLRAVLQERLVPLYDERLILDYVSPVAEDKEHRLRVAQAAPWARKVDEWRALAGEGPLDDDAGQVFVVPRNVVVVPALADEGLAPKRPQETPPADTPQETPPAGLEGLRAKASDPIALANAAAGAMRGELAAALARLGDWDEAALLAALEQGDTEAALAAFAWEAFEAALAATLEDGLWLLIGQVGGDKALPPLDLAAPEVREWLSAHVTEAVALVGIASRRALQGAITRELAGGAAAVLLVERLRPLVGLTDEQAWAVEAYRATLEEAGTPLDTVSGLVGRYADELREGRAGVIAGHEAVTAALIAQQLRWEQAQAAGALPEGQRKMWRTEGDQRVCPICAPLNGEVVPLRAAFSNGQLAGPAHLGCRCGVELVD